MGHEVVGAFLSTNAGGLSTPLRSGRDDASFGKKRHSPERGRRGFSVALPLKDLALPPGLPGLRNGLLPSANLAKVPGGLAEKLPGFLGPKLLPADFLAKGFLSPKLELRVERSELPSLRGLLNGRDGRSPVLRSRGASNLR